MPGWKYCECREEQRRMLFLLAYMEAVCLSRGYLTVIPDLSKCRKPKLDDTAALGFQDFDHRIQCLLSYSGIVIAQQTFAVFCNPYLSSILRGMPSFIQKYTVYEPILKICGIFCFSFYSAFFCKLDNNVCERFQKFLKGVNF